MLFAAPVTTAVRPSNRPLIRGPPALRAWASHPAWKPAMSGGRQASLVLPPTCTKARLCPPLACPKRPTSGGTHAHGPEPSGMWFEVGPGGGRSRVVAAGRDSAHRPDEAVASESAEERSRHCGTRSRALTTPARSRRANATMRPSSPSPDAAATSSTPCSATASSTHHQFVKPLSRLDEPHRAAVTDHVFDSDIGLHAEAQHTLRNLDPTIHDIEIKRPNPALVQQLRDLALESEARRSPRRSTSPRTAPA